MWDAARDCLWFVDIEGRRIHRLNTRTDARDGFDMPEVTPSIGLCRSGRLVVSQRHHVALFDPATGAMTRLTPDVGQADSNRLNDGKVGPDGCFWVGGMDENKPRQAVAALYRITPDGAVERKLDGLHVSNGLAWSPDGRTMYLSDTAIAAIDAFDFDPHTGALSRRRRFATLDEDIGRPDGGATDDEGCYWSAGMGAGSLNRFSPSGQLLTRVRVPVPCPTMPCFAGDDLFITSLRSGRPADMLQAYPSLGSLFRLRAPVVGAPVGVFAD